MSNNMFRNNIINMIDANINNLKISKNIERGIYNYAVCQAKSKNIVRKWENKYFLQLYKNRLRSIYLNMKNAEFLDKIKTKQITTAQLCKMTHQEMRPENGKN